MALRKIVEVKYGAKIQYLKFDEAWSQRPEVTDDINEATCFIDKDRQLKNALSGIRLPSDKFFAFSAMSVDEANIIEVEVQITEKTRVPAR